MFACTYIGIYIYTHRNVRFKILTNLQYTSLNLECLNGKEIFNNKKHPLTVERENTVI